MGNRSALCHRYGLVYDALYRLTTTTDPLNHTTTYTTDLLGHVLTVTDPVGRQTAYQYDGLYRRTQQTTGAQLPAAQQTVTTTTYDIHDKVSVVSVSGTPVATYTY